MRRELSKTGGGLVLGLALLLPPGAPAQEAVLVEAGSPMAYLANLADPWIGLAWTADGYDDSGWPRGTYGVGYEADTGAEALVRTTVHQSTRSVYTRVLFDIEDPARVRNVFLGADYDDGTIAWINGVEVYRSPSMPAGDPVWNTAADSHESSNAPEPHYGILEDISAAAVPVLHAGANLLAVGVWNRGEAGSSDLVLVPTLRMDVINGVARGPYLQTATPTGVIVRWRTYLDTDSRILYGTDPAALTEAVEEPTPTTEHVIRLSGLEPETTYHYAVGNAAGDILEGGPGHLFVTPPLPGPAKPMRIWVIGDSGTGDANAFAVRDAYAGLSDGLPTDLWLMLGDNAYEDGSDTQYQRAVFDTYPDLLRTSPLWPAYGNHDARSADSATQTGVYYAIFSLPTAGEAGGLASGTEAYYSFDYANVHFVCLDTSESIMTPGSPMLLWLQQDLAASTRDWNVVFFHHAPYTRGSYDSDTSTTLTEVRENIPPVLEEAGVDLVLAGHSHSYERSVLIDGHYGFSPEFGPAFTVDGGDGRPLGDGPYRKPTLGPAPHEGTVYANVGSSGKLGGGPLDHPIMEVSLNLYGSMVLDIAAGRLDGRFLDDTGALLDHFTMVKGCAAPPCIETDCLDGLDDDGDAAIDCDDLDCRWVDFDADTAPDCDDCAPRDPDAWEPAPEVPRLHVRRTDSTEDGEVEISWTDTSAVSGAATLYDLFSGGILALQADGGLAGAACLSPDLVGLSLEDDRPAGAPGDGWWYLARAQNSCGSGSLGPGPLGVERIAPPTGCD